MEAGPRQGLSGRQVATVCHMSEDLSRNGADSAGRDQIRDGHSGGHEDQGPGSWSSVTAEVKCRLGLEPG